MNAYEEYGIYPLVRQNKNLVVYIPPDENISLAKGQDKAYIYVINNKTTEWNNNSINLVEIDTDINQDVNQDKKR